jgi:2-methylcitrate dehydratase PrpD
MANALSTAAAQAAGLREMFGSMSKSLHAGKAAGNGAYSALLARHGWVSATHGIEGRVGYWAVLSERTDPARAVAGLGSAWELYNNGQKPYACGVVSHPTIDAVRQLRIAADLAPERVAEIRAEVNPYVLELMGKEEPAVGLEGKFSIFHCAAIGYIDRAARARQFTDQAVARPEVAALRRKVVVAVNRDLPTSAARVRLRSADGQVWEQSVEAASGTPRNPLSDEEIQEKFLDLVQERLGRSTAIQVAERALNARRLSRVDDLMIVTAAAGGH